MFDPALGQRSRIQQAVEFFEAALASTSSIVRHATVLFVAIDIVAAVLLEPIQG